MSVQYGSGCGRIFPAAEYFDGIYSAGWDYRWSYTIKGEEKGRLAPFAFELWKSYERYNRFAKFRSWTVLFQMELDVF